MPENEKPQSAPVATHSVPGKAQLIGLADEFAAYYRPTDEELRRVYASGIIVLDTNVLLDLYRLSPDARSSMLDLLNLLRDRLFIPHQVAFEFHENRSRAVAERQSEIDNVREQLNEMKGKAKGLVRQLSARTYGNAEAAHAAEESLNAAFGTAVEFSDRAAEEHDLDADKLVGSSDVIVDRLNEILQGRVGVRPAPDVLQRDRIEAKRRADAKEPPGYRDSKKVSNPDGDYLWWAEAVRYAGANPAPVVIIGNDTAKGDWAHTIRGLRIGPDPRLFAEMSAGTGHHLFLRSTSEFLADGARYFDLAISENALNEANLLPSPRRPPQEVDADDVPTLARLDSESLERFQELGWLPTEPIWDWKDLRRAAILSRASRMGADDNCLAMISDFTLGDRPPAHNVLVVKDIGCEWLRNRDIEQHLASLPSRPLMVIPLRDIEKRMRIVQASLGRNSSEDSD